MALSAEHVSAEDDCHGLTYLGSVCATPGSVVPAAPAMSNQMNSWKLLDMQLIAMHDTHVPMDPLTTQPPPLYPTP